MEIDSIKIGEYLRVYSLVLSMSINSNKPIYECFSNLVKNNETNLSLDEYNKMFLIKSYYSSSMLLFALKDVFQKGLNDVDADNKETFINVSSKTNKICLENFTDKDIIFYIRNAIAHNKNNLANIYIDEKDLKIKVRLQNTIASKGINKGQNIPFEVEFDNDDLLRMSAFCSHYSKTINISGVDFRQDVVTNSTTTNILKLLKDFVYTTYYNYTLFKTISDKDKEKLMKEYINGNSKKDMSTFDDIKTKFVRKEEIVNLSDNQKECIYDSMSQLIEKSLEHCDNTTPLILNLTKSNGEIRKILGSYVTHYYEYEALKVIPLGREKQNCYIVSVLLNSFNTQNETVFDTIVKLANDVKDRGISNSLFKIFNIFDKEELTMFIDNIFDPPYIEEEAISTFYAYYFENIIPASEVITIDGIQYESDRIRNAFTHGRWYFDETNGSWKLFDNKDSLKNADQYSFDWQATISSTSLQEFVNQKYNETIQEKPKGLK